MTIDWTKPIEYTDGSPARLIRSKNDGDGDFVVTPHRQPDCNSGNYYYRDGSPFYFTRTRLHIRNVKEEAVMETKFKVGDRVRHPTHGDGTIAFDDGANDWNLRVDLDNADDKGNAAYWVDADGRSSSYCDDQIITLVAEPEELTALRAFKAMALERYPDLEQKPETDEEAAHRIRNDWYDGNLNDVIEVAIAAIKWARENPRTTEIKEG